MIPKVKKGKNEGLDFKNNVENDKNSYYKSIFLLTYLMQQVISVFSPTGELVLALSTRNHPTVLHTYAYSMGTVPLCFLMTLVREESSHFICCLLLLVVFCLFVCFWPCSSDQYVLLWWLLVIQIPTYGGKVRWKGPVLMDGHPDSSM